MIFGTCKLHTTRSGVMQILSKFYHNKHLTRLYNNSVLSRYFTYHNAQMRCYSSATFITRNSSRDEIANVNFLYDDIVHALKIQ